MVVQFEAVCGPKFMTFWDGVGDALWLSTYLTDCLIMFSSEDRSLKLPLSCEVGPKRWFWTPDLYGERIPQIFDMRFQIAVTSQHVADFG